MNRVAAGFSTRKSGIFQALWPPTNFSFPIKVIGNRKEISSRAARKIKKVFQLRVKMKTNSSRWVKRTRMESIW